jgi:hypothetical protein
LDEIRSRRLATDYRPMGRDGRGFRSSGDKPGNAGQDATTSLRIEARDLGCVATGRSRVAAAGLGVIAGRLLITHKYACRRMPVLPGFAKPIGSRLA